MLLFDLVQNFRLRSKGKRRGILDMCVMPSCGRPQYAVAAAFVAATFPGQRLSGKQAQNRLEAFLRKNKKSVRYHPWPIARHILDVTLR